MWGEYEWQTYNVGSAPGGFISVESGAAASHSHLPQALGPVLRSCEAGACHGNPLSLFSPEEGKKLEWNEEGTDEK